MRSSFQADRRKTSLLSGLPSKAQKTPVLNRLHSFFISTFSRVALASSLYYIWQAGALLKDSVRGAPGFEDPDREKSGVLPVVHADAGHRDAFWHLDDREEGIKTQQLPAHRNTDHRAIGL